MAIWLLSQTVWDLCIAELELDNAVSWYRAMEDFNAHHHVNFEINIDQECHSLLYAIHYQYLDDVKK